MEIRIEKNRFLKGLHLIQSIVEKRNTMPVLANALIRTGENSIDILATTADGREAVSDIKWGGTKAYGLGINSLYLNVEGREPEGSVTKEGFNDLRNARRYYISAWETLVNEGGDDSQRLLEDYFLEPVIIWSIQLPDVYPLNSKTAVLAAEEPDLFSEGLLAVEFDIDQNGRATNIRIIESDPEGLMDKRVIYLLGRYFYRPRFEDGAPVLTKDIQLSHNFSYLANSAKKDPDKSKGNSDNRLEYPGAID